jgi:HlyD family secretion protein
MKIIDPTDADEGYMRRPSGGSGGEDVGPQGEALILELQRLRQAFERDNEADMQARQPRSAAPAGPPPAPRRSRAKRSKKKGKMGQVLNAWLGPFGSRADAFEDDVPAARTGRTVREPGFTKAPFTDQPRARGPIISPDDPPSGRVRSRGPIISPDDPSLMAMPRPAARTAPKPSPYQPSPNQPMPNNPAPRMALRAAPGPVDSRPVSEFAPAENMRPPLRIEAPRMAPLVSTGAVVPERPSGRMVDVCRQGLTAGVSFLVNRDGSPDAAGAPGESIVQRAGRAYERELRAGMRALLIVGGLAFGLMVLMPLSGAVVVPGNLVVQSNVKTIQHPTGGVVAQIPVRNGMRVNAGDLLLRLDATQAQASLQVVSKQLDEVRAKMSRLAAERDGLPRPAIPVELSARLEEDNVKSVLASEASLFRARLTARESQKELLQSKVSQLGEEIQGLEAQVASKAKQLELITGELTGVQELFDKRLVPIARLTTLQRESARIEGERGQLISTIAETKSKIGEAQLQIVKLDQDVRTEVVKELGEARGKEAELSERSIAARDVLERIEIRAPTSGMIHQLAAHTIGGVIRAGDAIMEVVPDSDDLQIEAKLQPNDIDQVRKGQQAYVRFSAFNQRTTPQLVGQVSYVSPDTTRDAQTNMSYFTVRIMLPEEERRLLAGLQLSSGMPAEVFMQTGSRTMLSYLFKPIMDQFQRAFVER